VNSVLARLAAVLIAVASLTTLQPARADSFTYAPARFDGTATVVAQAAAAPSGRDFASLSTDAWRGTVVLFGGLTPGGQALGDTWTWDGNIWAQQDPASSPPARHNAAMAQDGRRGTVLLFGGQAGGPGGTDLNDTWGWDGNAWTQFQPQANPLAQGDAAMVWDPTHHVTLLFSKDGTTWVWDGGNWLQQAAPSPPARTRASVAYDGANQVDVLFGGINDSGYLSDTWTWDGTNWTKRTPSSSPAGRDYAAMVSAPNMGKVLMFGGFYVAGGAPPLPHDLNDTWSWDGTSWIQLSPAASPPALSGAVLVNSPDNAQALLWGRRSNLSAPAPNDFWIWDGHNWTQLAP